MTPPRLAGSCGIPVARRRRPRGFYSERCFSQLILQTHPVKWKIRVYIRIQVRADDFGGATYTPALALCTAPRRPSRHLDRNGERRWPSTLSSPKRRPTLVGTEMKLGQGGTMFLDSGGYRTEVFRFGSPVNPEHASSPSSVSSYRQAARPELASTGKQPMLDQPGKQRILSWETNPLKKSFVRARQGGDRG